MPRDRIVVRGAREHNLKNITVEIPRDKFVVLTGISGSGKSSLAFDTIYAEGQRKYVESLSAYARQFLGLMEKPDVDHIDGLSPAVSIDQKGAPRNPRSTVGTVTEVYDYLRLLYARAGIPHCPKCGKPISRQTREQIVDQVLARPEGSRIQVLGPIVRGRKGEYRQLFEDLRRQGFARVRVDGIVAELGDEISLDKNKKHWIEVVVDRIVTRSDIQTRLADSVETALKLGQGIMYVEVLPKEANAGTPTRTRGVARERGNAKRRAVADPTARLLVFSQLFACPDHGSVLPEIEPRIFSFNSPHGACPTCTGLGFRQEFDPDLILDWDKSLSVRVGGRNIAELTALTVRQTLDFFNVLTLSDRERMIAAQILKEIKARLGFLVDVGLDYLTLDRTATTLSGGEAQRIRLATQIGSGLMGVLYVLDEPSVGLHQRDNRRLIDTLMRLRDLGNTILVVEHDEETIRSADWVVDIGPGAGAHGGEIVVSGTPDDIARHPDSITGQYLSGRKRIPIPAQRRSQNGQHVTVRGAREHNLKDIDVRIPLSMFVAVTGVSGSGKSTLVDEILYRALTSRLHGTRVRAGAHTRIDGIENVDKVINIDQSPIGRTPRSNPATYTKTFDLIRDLFAMTPDAKTRGFTPGRFSFNVRGGRCEACEGDGIVRIEMHFLPDVYVPCEVCKGKRYNRETLEVHYRGKSIADVLEMTVAEGLQFFENVPRIRRKLQTLHDVGLGYVQLGQPATTLSGGEAQRVKLATELSRRDTGRTLYILDEPTVGLHFADVERLLHVLHRLVDAGNTVVVIEHNLDVIKTADWIIDLGPEGGDLGGQVVAEGPPEDVAAAAHSYTGQFLTRVLSREPEFVLTGHGRRRRQRRE